MGALALLSRPNTRQVTGYVAGKPATLYLLSVAAGMWLRADAAIAFLRMAAAAAREDVLLQLISAFRSMEEQRVLYARYLEGGNLAAEPGFSNHQGGIAVDINTGGSRNTRVYMWLARNAERFGFVRTVRSELWHFEYRPGEKASSFT